MRYNPPVLIVTKYNPKMGILNALEDSKPHHFIDGRDVLSKIFVTFLIVSAMACAFAGGMWTGITLCGGS